MRMRILFGLLLLLGVATPAVSMNIRIQEWKFDKDAPGSIPVGFVPGKLNSEAGHWQVANDPKAPSAPKVLAWQGTDHAAKDQIIFIEGLEAGSLDVTLRVKSATASEGQGEHRAQHPHPGLPGLLGLGAAGSAEKHDPIDLREARQRQRADQGEAGDTQHRQPKRPALFRRAAP